MVASCYGTQGNIVICRCVPVVCDSVFALDERGNGSYPVRRLVLHVANRCAELRGSWRQSTWMDFRLLEIDCVILAILGEFILLRQSSVMSSILLINQPVDPLTPFRVLITCTQLQPIIELISLYQIFLPTFQPTHCQSLFRHLTNSFH